MILGILLGFQLRESTQEKKPMSSIGKADKLEEVMNLLEVKYVDTLNREEMNEKVIEALLKELDPHSYYIHAKDLTRVNEDLEGNFEGIGVEFYLLNDTIIVVSSIAGGPSEKLGIQAGDKIITIEDSLVAGVGFTNKDVIGKLRGEKGTEVTVGILRNGADELIEFTITRDEIPLFSVDIGYMVDEETGYIKVNRFSATTSREFMDTLFMLKEAGMKNLIIDLRQNPGGYLRSAIDIADEMVGGRDLLVYTEGQAYNRSNYNSQPGGVFEYGDLTVLIDEGSASASEILAGAVQDLDRGVIVGRRSFGKGLVQEQYMLRDSSALRLTVARYYTPSGRSIQKPYNQGEDAYNAELSERFTGGEYYSADSIEFPDSLTYYTSRGNKVYGGGGIMPDVFVPLDTAMNYDYFARVRVHVPEFIYDHYSKQIEYYYSLSSLKQYLNDFQIPDEVYQEFIDKAVENGLKRNEQELAKLEFHIRTTLKAYLGRQIWGGKAFYPVLHQIDPTFKKGYELVVE